jgi:hypothetical protein
VHDITLAAKWENSVSRKELWRVGHREGERSGEIIHIEEKSKKNSS